MDGLDKSRLVVDGRAIIVRQLDVLRRIASEIRIIAGDAARFSDLDVPVVADLLPGTGALGGLYTGVVTAAAERVIVVACDQPYLDDRVLARLVDLAGRADGAWIRTTRGVEPFLACYQRRTAPRIRRALERGRLRAGDLGDVLDMAALTGDELASFGAVDRLLFNVNTPDDYARVQ
jgi:molybdopterin-guanine dinucleotide biosynthesis protein A